MATLLESGTFSHVSNLIPAYPNPPHVHEDLIIEWARGATIQRYSNPLKRWVDCEDNKPSWSPDAKYRVKPSNPHQDKIEEIENTIAELQQKVKELKDETN